MAFTMVTKIQTEHIKALVVEHTACSHYVIGTTAALPAMKQDNQAFAVTRLRGVVTQQSHFIPTVQYPVLLRIQHGF